MSYKDLIPGCFGERDLIFGSHPLDIKRCKEMLKKTFDECDSYSEFETSIKNFLKSKGANTEHIEKQLSNLRDLSSFFPYD